MPDEIVTIPYDKEMNSTDFAHPAWWDGSDHSAHMICLKLQESIDGKDDGRGVFGSPELEKIRRWILEARKKIETKV